MIDDKDRGWRFPFKIPDERDVPPLLGNIGAVLLCVLAIGCVIAVVTVVGKLVVASIAFPISGDTGYVALRNVAWTLAAVIGLPFVVWRSWVSHRQSLFANKQSETAEQGLITSRITKAVEQLGVEKTVKVRARPVEFTYLDAGEKKIGHGVQYLGEEPRVPPSAVVDWDKLSLEDFKESEETRPNIEIRLGAIYALERIAKDSLRDRIPIMEILCAYIRENAPVTSAIPNPLPNWEPLKEDVEHETRAVQEAALEERLGSAILALSGRYDDEDFAIHEVARRDNKSIDSTNDGKVRVWANSLPKPRADIQTALTVIGRRSADRREMEASERYRLDLRGTNLQGATLSYTNLGVALLTDAHLEGANLFHADLHDAAFWDARLDGAFLQNAKMQDIDLRNASLEGAILRRADMANANLEHAILRGAAMREALLTSSRLLNAKLDHAELLKCDLSSADICRASMTETYLRAATLIGARFNGSTMAGANLRSANASDAYFVDVNLRGARLRGLNLKDASLQRSDLSGAHFSYTKLQGTCFGEASLGGAAFRNVDLSKANEIDRKVLEGAFGDGTVTLPKDCARPGDWPAARLESGSFNRRWRGCREAKGLPWPPRRRTTYADDDPPIPPGTKVQLEEIEGE